MNVYEIIKRPILTEKVGLMSQQASGSNCYFFEVDKRANKIDIRRAVEAVFKVSVTDVHTITVHGKPKRNPRARSAIKMPDWKKAVVTLKKGDKIEFGAKA